MAKVFGSWFKQIVERKKRDFLDIGKLNTTRTFNSIKELLTSTSKCLGDFMALWLFLKCLYLLEIHARIFIDKVI